MRLKHEKLLLEKLYAMGILSEGVRLGEVERKVGASRMARRRLGVVMTRLGMSETVQGVSYFYPSRVFGSFGGKKGGGAGLTVWVMGQAVKFIEQGHVRVGPEVVTDPAFLVTRNMEDFVTWVDSSKVKRNILKYRDKLDDFDLL